eukprot:CCRYP_004837-RA/>CCRYP_004837-RA protein AED:0.52 eAED:0.52 QI:0/-1/0/1/-1/0/1/0/135
MRLTLEELGHPQPPTRIHVDNSTTVGIVNNTIKRQKSRSMEMRYFRLLTEKYNSYSIFSTTQGSRIWQITLAKVIRGVIISQLDLFIYICLTKPSKRRGCVDQGKPTYCSRHLIPDLLHLPSVVARTAMAPAAAA